MALLLILLPGLGAQRLAAQNETPTFRAGVSDVRLDVQVETPRGLVNDLGKDDFVVSDGGAPQPLIYFGHDSEPVSLLLLLDVSGSMQKRLDEMASRAREALNVLRPADRVAILVFGRRTAVHQDFSDNLAESARQVALSVRGHDVGAGTAINAAIIDAARYLREHPLAEPGRNAILIVTDNLCINYKIPDDQVVRELSASDAVLDAIVTGRAIRPVPPKNGVYYNPDFTPADVFHLAEETGGVAVKADQMGKALRDMIEAIRARYSLSYHVPEGVAPGVWRHVEVDLSAAARQRYPNARLRYRPGYFTPGS